MHVTNVTKNLSMQRKTKPLKILSSTDSEIVNETFDTLDNDNETDNGGDNDSEYEFHQSF